MTWKEIVNLYRAVAWLTKEGVIWVLVFAFVDRRDFWNRVGEAAAYFLLLSVGLGLVYGALCEDLAAGRIR